VSSTIPSQRSSNRDDFSGCGDRPTQGEPEAADNPEQTLTKTLLDLVPLPPHSLRVGQVLTFSVRDAEGKLLIASGQQLGDTPQVQALIERGGWVRANETLAYQRALAHKMDTMLHQGATLGAIARAEADVQPDRQRVQTLELHTQWSELQLRVHSLMRAPRAADFLPRFEALHAEALALLQAHPDASLMCLIFEASQNFRQYSAKHGLLRLALAELCARQLGWDEDRRQALTRAALSMNISIAGQQDQLATQSEPLSEAQRLELERLRRQAAELLATLGVRSALWLHAVRLQPAIGPGALSGRAPAEQLARLLRRVDIFGARLSPRRGRRALAGASAARAIYLDEQRQADEAGAALVKAVGLYPPGSLVRLVNGEVGIVFKRGHSANEPLVAALLGKSGAPLSEPVPRDTRLAAQAIESSLAPHEMKLLLNLDKLMKLY
jgi:HD-GYP domain-containing protein (c-di-GMP phosphodiesterase class II)